MLVKNYIETLMESDEADADPRGVPIPHRINLESVEELLRNGNKRRAADPDQRKPVVGAVQQQQQQPDKFIKVPGAKARKPPKAISENRKLTEYYPVRRSVRKCQKDLLKERQRELEKKISKGVEDGLQIRHFLGKGRGVVTTRDFVKGEFVVEYIGELIDQLEAKKREAKYTKDQNAGCYMYYFQHKNQQYCVDATADSDKLGRLVNHSRYGNLVTRIVEVESIPHLVLIAKNDIPAGTELSYDYGDRSGESLYHHPWLAT